MAFGRQNQLADIHGHWKKGTPAPRTLAGSICLSPGKASFFERQTASAFDEATNGDCYDEA